MGIEYKVIDINEVPVGIISTYPLEYPRPLEYLRDAYIDVIEVNEKYRQQGIARGMITRTEEWAKSLVILPEEQFKSE